MMTTQKNTINRIVTFAELGEPEMLKLVHVPLAAPAHDEVRIKVEALGLNRAEVLYRVGMYTEQAILPSKIGYEASGVVDAIGADVKSLKIGDRVSTIPGFSLNKHGVAGEYAIVPEKHALKYPDILSSEEATAIWMQYVTVYGMLVEFGKVKKDDFVLITAASSSVGIAAIQLLNDIGAKSIAVTRKADKKSALLNAGAQHVIVTDEENLNDRIADITQGKGAHIVIDPIGGPMIDVLADSVANEGLIIEYGWLQEGVPVFPSIKALVKGFKIQGFHLSYHIADKPERFAAAIRYVYDRLASGAFKPLLADKIFDLEHIVDAYHYMESNEQIGKIIVRVNN